jgi:hypothetical protein
MLMTPWSAPEKKRHSPGPVVIPFPSGGLKGITMTFYGRRCILILGPVVTLLLAFVSPAFSQQVTYYDFDAPQANNGASYACVDPAHTVPAPSTSAPSRTLLWVLHPDPDSEQSEEEREGWETFPFMRQ